MKLLLSLLLATNISLFAFTTYNIQFLHGKFDGNGAIYDTNDGGYKSTFTAEVFSANEIGDVFAFFDYTIAKESMLYTDDKTTIYGEVSPRLNLSYLIGHSLSFSIFKDFFLASQINAGDSADFRAVLFGMGTDIDIVGFDFFSLNAYYKYVELTLPDASNGFVDKDLTRDTFQISAAYGSTFGSSGFSLTGWFDWTGYSFQTQNQFLYDLFVLEDSSSLQAGFEHLYYYEIKDDFNGKHTSNRPISNTLQVMLESV